MGLFIKIINDGTGDVETGNYKYTVYINEEVVAMGHIKNYKRRNGWKGLVRRMALSLIDRELESLESEE